MTWWWEGMAGPAGQALWLAWGMVAGVTAGGEVCRHWLADGSYRSIAQYLPPLGVLLAGLVVIWPDLPAPDVTGSAPVEMVSSTLSRAEYSARDDAPAGWVGCGHAAGQRNKVME